jgi:pimeloyl-ACP methyl ester carboxylesterase
MTASSPLGAAGRLLILAVVATSAPPRAQALLPVADLGPRLERFSYPYPVQNFAASPQGERVEMSYMDVRPARPNGRTVVLLHGKNFCGATWGDTAARLAGAGYRVVVPDQIGFCKSSKPPAFQYSFHALASLTRDLLQSLGVDRAAVVGHSMGGMLATRYALLYPAAVERLVLVNPLGLADRLGQGVPYAGLAALLTEERRTTAATIKAYQLENYYGGRWRADYDRWVLMLAGMYAGSGKDLVALAQAKTSDMIQTQPVAYELARLKVPTTLMVGMKDKTAFGRARAPASLRASIPAIPALASDAATRIPDASLVPFVDLGHSPQVEDPERFQAALLQALRAR